DLGNPQALNRYSYVLNQLLRLVDPGGHMYDDPSEGSFTTTGNTDSTPSSDIGTASDTTGDSSVTYSTLVGQGGDAAASVPEPLQTGAAAQPGAGSSSPSEADNRLSAGVG